MLLGPLSYAKERANYLEKGARFFGEGGADFCGLGAIDAHHAAIDRDDGNFNLPAAGEFLAAVDIDVLHFLAELAGNGMHGGGGHLAQVAAWALKDHDARARGRQKPGTMSRTVHGPELIEKRGGQAAAGATNSASMPIFTSSPTRTPPVSRAAFQVRPKSLRDTLALPEKPAR